MRCLWDRSVMGGPVSSKRTRSLFIENRLRFLDVSSNIEIRASKEHRGPVVWIDVDQKYDHMILSGNKDCSVSLYNLEVRNEEHSSKAVDGSFSRNVFTPIAHIDRGSQLAHKYAVTAVQWYPVDNGCFVTGSHDGTVKIWATESCQVMSEIKCSRHIYAAKMPKLAAQAGAHHCLIAVGGDDGDMRLIDIRAESTRQYLSGHDGTVCTVDWSPTSEYMLATGGSDCSVRLWDIRRSGESACRSSLDQFMTSHSLPQEDAPYHLPQSHSLSKKKKKTSTPKHWFEYDESNLMRTRIRPRLATAHLKPVHAVVFSPDGRYLVTSASDGIHMWNLTLPAPTLCPVDFNGASNQCEHGQIGLTILQPCCHAFPADGGRSRAGIVVCVPNNPESSILTYNVDPSQTYCEGWGAGLGRVRKLKGHMAAAHCVVSRPSTSQLISGGEDGLMMVWEFSQLAALKYQKQRSRLNKRKLQVVDSMTSSNSNVLLSPSLTPSSSTALSSSSSSSSSSTFASSIAVRPPTVGAPSAFEDEDCWSDEDDSNSRSAAASDNLFLSSSVGRGIYNKRRNHNAHR